jgi:glycosyltransferase involved in cell wall biosynthesis
MSRYLLSVVIPTKTDSFYCLKAVKQILDIGDKRIQIIVQDNSSREQPVGKLG